MQTLCDQLTHPEPILAPKLIDSPSLDTLQNPDHSMDNLEHREATKFESVQKECRHEAVINSDPATPQISNEKSLTDKIKIEKVETGTSQNENLTDNSQFQRELDIVQTVKSFKMPSPNYTLILQEESYFTLPKEYTCLKLEYSRMQAILTDRPAKKRRQNRASQSSSLHDPELLLNETLNFDSIPLSSENLICDIVPRSYLKRSLLAIL